VDIQSLSLDLPVQENNLNKTKVRFNRMNQKDLEVYVMAEIPSNIIGAEAFASRFDGFSNGSNDLTQLVLGELRVSEN
jgi:phosphoenolpyruvate synthase/pyruvate phosphate dikinase